jgi:YihY family inner membrane protein
MTVGAAFQFVFYPATRKALREYIRRWKPVLSNLISSDVYTMASAISTCAVISFFPFIFLLLSIVKQLFGLNTTPQAISDLIKAYLPYLGNALNDITTDIGSHGVGRLQLISAVILIVSAIGVFIPIEVTLNRIWNAPANMGVLRNQAVSFVVLLICGVLSLLSFLIGEMNWLLIHATLGRLSSPRPEAIAELLSVKVLGFLLSIALFFVVFSLLPNVPLRFGTALRASVFTGVVWDLGRYGYLWSLRKLDLSAIYGQYFTSAVVLILWTYVSAMIMILGAELAHRELLSVEIFRPAYEEWRSLHADGRRLV